MPDLNTKRRGRSFNKEWGIGAKHALYRANGTWYHRLTAFPGALIDAHGYILFATEQDYVQCQGLHIGKQIGVPHGIARIPGYKWVQPAADIPGAQEELEQLQASEQLMSQVPDVNLLSSTARAGRPKRKRSIVGEPLRPKPPAPRHLDIKDEKDLAVLSVARTLQMQRLHNAMTNALLYTVGGRKAVFEGNRQEAMFDALILDYKGPKKDLLIEVKSSTNIADVRLAIGQLLDYRRFVNRPDATDLAVLLPEEPDAHVCELLRTCDILLLWFEDKATLSRIQGALEGIF